MSSDGRVHVLVGIGTHPAVQVAAAAKDDALVVVGAQLVAQLRVGLVRRLGREDDVLGSREEENGYAGEPSDRCAN